jgi:hypothetical protein
MAQSPAETARTTETEPRWPAVLALIAMAVVVLLLIPTIMTRRLRRHRANEMFGYLVSAVVTADMLWSLFLLVSALLAHKVEPLQLLRSAAALWLSNILVFASWYWRLDAGGPNARDLRGAHTDGAFLFPQMTLLPAARKAMGEDTWNPGFIDYLFIAFNTSTAFSPTDCPVLSRWAKVMMMMQSMIAFSTVVLLAARAVNIL